MSVVTINGVGAAANAGRGVSSIQDKLLSVTNKQVTGKRVVPRETPAEVASLNQMLKKQLETRQYVANMDRGAAITKTALQGLQAMKTQLEEALEAAEKVASNTQTADEISILVNKFDQAISAADQVAQNTNFLGDQIIATGSAGSGTVQSDSAVAESATTAFDANTINTVAYEGNIFGRVKDVTAVNTAVTGLYNVTVTMEDNGNTYTFSGTVGGVVDATSGLVSSLDNQSIMKITNDANVAALTSAADLQGALRQYFQVSNDAAPNTSFVPDNDSLHANFGSIDLTNAVDGAGTYRITQDANTPANLTIIAPNLKTYSVTLSAASTTYYAGGVKITTGASWTSSTDLTEGNNAHYQSIEKTTSTAGYSAAVSGGEADITLSISNHRATALGVDSGSINVATVSAASTAKTTLSNVLTNLAKTIGRLGAIEGRFISTGENLAAQNDTLSEVVASVEDTNLVEVSEEAVQLQLQQQFAADAFASSVNHQKALLQKLGQAQ